MRQSLLFVLAALVTLLSSGCIDVKAACIDAGICDTPPQATLTIDIVCDSSEGATCTRDTVAETLDAALPVIAERPGSTLRVWSMSGTVDGVVTVGNVTSPENSPSTRAKKRDQEAFAKAAKGTLILAAETALGHPARQSPIADTLARVLMASSGDERRTIVLVSDMREFSSGRYDFECGPLPAPEAFIRALRQERVLAADAMKNIAVAFTYVGVPPVDGRRCAATIQRAKAIEAIWRTTVTSSGGTVVVYTDGALQPTDLAR